jgi:hypothetical protein
VFAAGRRENVVVADTLIFPNHQVRLISFFGVKTDHFRRPQLSCIKNHELTFAGWSGGFVCV